MDKNRTENKYGHLISRDLILTQLTYNPDTGKFYKLSGLEVGSDPTKNRNYSTIWVILSNGKRVRFDAHRLAFLMVHGFIPLFIDHINGIGSDNRIVNLRECTNNQNSQNKKVSKNNVSGKKGVSYFKSRNKWNARILSNEISTKTGKPIYKNLGYFDTVSEAHQAYAIAAELYFGEFAKF